MALMDRTSARKRLAVRGGVAIGLLAVSAVLILRSFPEGESESAQPRKLYADVKRVKSGLKIELEDDTLLTYAGIRAPFPGEPLYEQASKRNAELVERRRIRLRFDDIKENRKGRKQAYVFVDGGFVNETLVREGLAYVRITTDTQRFADRLLAAQEDAQKKRRGLWQQGAPKRERSYFADPKYGNFHRPSCEEAGKIKPQRKVTFTSRREAFANGYAPCSKCKP